MYAGSTDGDCDINSAIDEQARWIWKLREVFKDGSSEPGEIAGRQRLVARLHEIDTEGRPAMCVGGRITPVDDGVTQHSASLDRRTLPGIHAGGAMINTLTTVV